MTASVTLTVDLGETADEAAIMAADLARQIYKAFPINDSRGQIAKNTLVHELFNRSERSERAAKARFGLVEEPKPVRPDQYTKTIEDFEVDFAGIENLDGVTVTRDEEGDIFIHIPSQ